MESLKALFDHYINIASDSKIILLAFFVWLYLVRNADLTKKLILRLERSRAVLFWVLLIAFALRLIWTLWSPHTPPSAHTEDKIILDLAHNLAVGKGFIGGDGRAMATRPVGYPLFLSLVFRVFGERIWLIELLQVMLGVLSVWLLSLLVKGLMNQMAALIAAFIFAINPTAVFSTKIAMDEHLFMPLWLAGILFLVLDLQKPKVLKVLLAGLCFGLGAHLRTHSFAMGFVAFAAWLMVRKDWRRGLVRLLLIQTVALTFAVPWAIRNYVKMGSPILYSTALGLAMYWANNENPANVNYPLEQGGDPDFILARSEAERHEAGKRAALRWIRKNPATYLDRSLRRILFMLGLQKEGWVVVDNFHNIKAGRKMPPPGVVKIFEKYDYTSYRFLFLSAFAGLMIYFLRWKKWPEQEKGIWVVVLTIFYYLSSAFLVLTFRKYRFPLEPLFCVLAAYLFFVILSSNRAYLSRPTQSFRDLGRAGP